MADTRELNTIVSDIHSHGKGALQPELSRLKDNLDRGNSKQFQQDLIRITTQLKAMGDDTRSLDLPDLSLNGFTSVEKAQTNLQPDTPPTWLTDGVAKGQIWIPENVRREGVDKAYQERMNSLPPDVQSAVNKMNIPHWMVSMMPAPDAKSANEFYGNIKFVSQIEAPRGTSAMAERMQTLIAFAGAAKLPTPGDARGNSLGNEGCTAAISHYVITPLKAEFPQLRDLPDATTTTLFSGTLENLLMHYSQKHPELLSVSAKSIDDFGVDDIHPGSLTIGHKFGGTHCFGWSQVPPAWTTSRGAYGWRQGEYIAIGNTGLAEFGAPHMSLAQDYLSPYPDRRDMMIPSGGTMHGALNSHRGGNPNEISTNPYYHPGSKFMTFSFKG